MSKKTPNNANAPATAGAHDDQSFEEFTGEIVAGLERMRTPADCIRITAGKSDTISNGYEWWAEPFGGRVVAGADLEILLPVQRSKKSLLKSLRAIAHAVECYWPKLRTKDPVAISVLVNEIREEEERKARALLKNRPPEDDAVPSTWPESRHKAAMDAVVRAAGMAFLWLPAETQARYLAREPGTIPADALRIVAAVIEGDPAVDKAA